MFFAMRQSVFWTFTLTILLMGRPELLHADPFSLTGNWSYQENGGEGVEKSGVFNQSYSLSGTKSLSGATQFSGSFRYARSSRKEGKDNVQMSPSLTLGVRNDLFSADFSGTQTQRDAEGGPELTNRTWSVTGFSLIEDLPRLRLSYGQSRSRDDQFPHSQDTESDFFNAGIDYSWNVLDFYYDFLNTSNSNHLVTSTTEAERHFAKVGYGDSFFQGRVSVNLSQSGMFQKSETSGRVATGGTLFLPITLSQTYAALDDTPSSGELTANGALNDGDTATPTSVDIAQTIDQNLGMQTDFQPVSQLRVYLDQEIALSVQGQLNWSLYISDGGITWPWTLVSASPVVNYTVENGRTVVIVDVPGPALLEQYVKLVVSFSGLPAPVYVTELRAGRTVVATGDQVIASSRLDNYQTSANISYHPVENWSFVYSMSRVENEPDPGLKNTRFNQLLSANYVASSRLSTSASVSEYRDKTENRENHLSRSYALTLQKQVWETMSMSLGYTHSEQYQDSTKNHVGDSINSYVTAQLFPDLAADCNLNWSRAENPQEDNKNESYGGRVSSTAQLTARVNAHAYYDYWTNRGDAGETGGEADMIHYGASVNVRTSDLLSFHANLDRDAVAQETHFSGTASLRASPKLQTVFSTSQVLEGDGTESYGASLAWTVSSHVSLQSSARYQLVQGDDAWSWRLSANATF